MQFGGFLGTQLNTDDYKANLPSLEELRRIYHITPDEAFCLSRSVYRYAIQASVLVLTLVFLSTKFRQFHSAVPFGMPGIIDMRKRVSTAGRHSEYMQALLIHIYYIY